MNYTDEQVDFLRQHTADDWSAAEVMRAFNRTFGTDISRNAVLGKLDRLKANRPKRVKVKAKAKEPRARVAFLPHLRRMAAGVPEPERGPLPFTGDPAEIAPEQRRTLLELNNHTCRYPYGDPSTPEFFFCGSLTADCSGGRPFCPAHSAIAYHRHYSGLSEDEQDRRRDLVRGAQVIKRRYAAARKRAAA